MHIETNGGNNSDRKFRLMPNPSVIMLWLAIRNPQRFATIYVYCLLQVLEPKRMNSNSLGSAAILKNAEESLEFHKHKRASTYEPPGSAPADISTFSSKKAQDKSMVYVVQNISTDLFRVPVEATKLLVPYFTYHNQASTNLSQETFRLVACVGQNTKMFQKCCFPLVCQSFDFDVWLYRQWIYLQPLIFWAVAVLSNPV